MNRVSSTFQYLCFSFFFSSRRRHTRFDCDWSSDVCSSDLHDPWKTEDATGIGIVHQMIEHGQWIVPFLAGEPYLEDGPFHYWIAALTAKLFGLVLAPHDGARLASGVMMAAVA